MNMEHPKLYNNQEEKRYEYRLDDATPHITYERRGNEIALTHTRVPAQLRGKGVGTMLAKDALDDIADQKLEVVPLCSFVATYMKRHPEYMHLLKKGITIG